MLALLLALQTMPQSPASVRLHYRVVSSSTIDLGTGSAPLVLKMSAFIAVTLTESTAGRVADVSIYWSAFDAGAMTGSLPSQLLADPNGVTLHGYFRDGRMISLVPSAPNLQAMQLIPAIRLVLTATRSVRPGDRWLDSTTTDSISAAASSQERLSTAWTVKPGAGGGAEFEGAMTGTTTLAAGGMRLDLPITGSSRLTTHTERQARTASSVTTGQGDLKIGTGSLVMKLRNEVSATLFPTAAWAAIP